MSIKNIHYIGDRLSKNDLHQLEKAAGFYAGNSRVTFKLLKLDDEQLIIEARQGKKPAAPINPYMTAKELVERTKYLFGEFFPELEIHVRPQPFTPSPVDEVDPEWVQTNMNGNSVSLKQMSKATGIDKTNLSNWVNGNKPMSQPVKAMFYFMFLNPKNLFQ